MSKAMRKLRQRITSLAILVVSFLILRYWADFSINQTIALTILTYIVLETMRIEGHRDKFRPFRVSVLPNWNNLLADYGWIKNDEDKERFRHARSEAYLHFTFLKPDLIYWDEGKRFVSKVDFRLAPFDDTVRLFDPFVGLYFQWGIGGYELKITSPQWFQDTHGQDPRLRNEPPTAAFLPNAEFSMYHIWGYAEGLSTINKAIEAHGWKREKVDPEWAQVSGDYGTLLEHKYCKIKHAEI
jgi:hypothetical protein